MDTPKNNSLPIGLIESFSEIKDAFLGKANEHGILNGISLVLVNGVVSLMINAEDVIVKQP